VNTIFKLRKYLIFNVTLISVCFGDFGIKINYASSTLPIELSSAFRSRRRRKLRAKSSILKKIKKDYLKIFT